jgi:hypothetical protein
VRRFVKSEEGCGWVFMTVRLFEVSSWISGMVPFDMNALGSRDVANYLYGVGMPLNRGGLGRIQRVLWSAYVV